MLTFLIGYGIWSVIVLAATGLWTWHCVRTNRQPLDDLPDLDEPIRAVPAELILP
jgi:hypothetical protein